MLTSGSRSGTLTASAPARWRGSMTRARTAEELRVAAVRDQGEIAAQEPSDGRIEGHPPSVDVVDPCAQLARLDLLRPGFEEQGVVTGELPEAQREDAGDRLVVVPVDQPLGGGRIAAGVGEVAGTCAAAVAGKDERHEDGVGRDFVEATKEPLELRVRLNIGAQYNAEVEERDRRQGGDADHSRRTTERGQPGDQHEPRIGGETHLD